MSDKSEGGQGNRGARRMIGLSEDQMNAAYIIEKIMCRRNYTTKTRDRLAEALAHIKNGGTLGKPLPIKERA